MSTIVFDIEVAFQPEITKMAIERGIDEKKMSWHIDAATRYVTHVSYKVDKQSVVDLSLLDFYPAASLSGDGGERQLLEAFSQVYNRCDESVAHYGSKFDIRFLNSRIAKYGLPRLKPLRLIDTWRILKDKFALPDNKLDTAIKFFKCPYGKPSLPWEIWRRVSLGDEKAHKLLRHRCRFDTLSLAWIYWTKLRVYDSTKVNRALAHELGPVDDKNIAFQLIRQHCPSCEKRGSLKREGFRYNKAGTNVQLSCRACFDWCHAPLRGDGSLGRVR